jgi:hypothetical protein
MVNDVEMGRDWPDIRQAAIQSRMRSIAGYHSEVFRAYGRRVLRVHRNAERIGERDVVILLLDLSTGFANKTATRLVGLARVEAALKAQTNPYRRPIILLVETRERLRDLDIVHWPRLRERLASPLSKGESLIFIASDREEDTTVFEFPPDTRCEALDAMHARRICFLCQKPDAEHEWTAQLRICAICINRPIEVEMGPSGHTEALAAIGTTPSLRSNDLSDELFASANKSRLQIADAPP